MEKLVRIALTDIEPNPNRDLKFNPYNEEKIAALINSINETGFWTNVEVRLHPEKKGKYQQAYGHHRVESARRCGIKEAEFVVQNLDENMMLKKMELENQEDYRYSPMSLLETCRAVVKALADGRIPPFHKIAEENSSNTEGAYFRYAPSFSIDVSKVLTKQNVNKSYTAFDVSCYLGKSYKLRGQDRAAHKNIICALDALWLMEIGALTRTAIEGYNWAQLIRVVADLKSEKQRVAKREASVQKAVAKANDEALRLQAAQKEREREATEERQRLLEAQAKAEQEENERKAKVIQAKLDAQEEKEEQQKEEFKAKHEAIQEKVKTAKANAKAAAKEDEYVPIQQQASRIIRLLNERKYEEEFKALSRKKLRPEDRELVRQAALDAGNWYTNIVSSMFLPPATVSQQLEDYKKREIAKRKTEKKEKD